MALETVATIYDLVATNPTAGDQVSQADDHQRNIKAALLASFAGSAGSSGYQKIGRSIVQWGVGSTTAGTGTVTYPIAFPNGTRVAFAGLSTSSVNAPIFVNAGTATTTQLTVLACDTAGAGQSISFKWLAIGD